MTHKIYLGKVLFKKIRYVNFLYELFIIFCLPVNFIIYSVEGNSFF